MPRKLSRRAMAEYFVDELHKGVAVKKLSRQLAAYLIESRRTKELSIMTRDIQYYLAEKGHVMGTITTAHQLSDGAKKAIEAYAKKSTGAKQVKLDSNVDQSVLGGLKLDLPGQELNATILRQLTILKTKYKKA